MIRWMLMAALAAAPAAAQDAPQESAAQGSAPKQVATTQDDDASTPPKRIRNVLLFGNEACPKPTTPDEIVVCAKGGDSPYRIPPQFRQPKKTPANTSWARRMEYVEEVNRAGLPNSCSPVGSGGQTGCTRQQIEQWAQEKLERQAAEASVP